MTEVFKSPFFREFVVKPKVSPDKLNKELLNDGIIGGYDLSGDYPELDGCWLVAVTEKRTKAEIDMFSEKVKEYAREGCKYEG